MNNGRSGSRAPGSGRGAILALLLLALAATMLAAGSADAHTATPFNYGLAAHVSAPRWARGRGVHFFPARSPAGTGSTLAAVGSLATGSLAAGQAAPFDEDEPEEPEGPEVNSPEGDEGDLGRRCGGCLGVPLRYYGGSVQHEPEVHVIFWGSNWKAGDGPLLHQELMRFYEGLSSSPSGLAFQGILTQYFDTTGRVAPSLAPQRLSSFTDESVAAPKSVSDESLRAEAKAAAENPKNRWALEPNAQFVVVPAPGATFESTFDQNFCAYHSDVFEPGNKYWTYTFLSYVGEEPFEGGCLSYDGDATASHAEKAAHVLAMDASHEYAESATDPTFEAWLDQEGNELADICSSGDDQLANDAWVQGLWDDHQSTCSLGDQEPPHVLGLTEAASNVGPGEATVNATVNPENEGLEASYHFEYGPTTAYGRSAPAAGPVSAGSAQANRQVQQTISGLAEGSTYHYRVVATDTREGRQQTTFGEDHTFVPSPWATGDARPLTNGQASFGSALISCSFVPWSCGGASCPSRTSCVAVGSYELNGPEVPMAETWLDGRWSFEALPVPAQTGEQVALTGISCPSEGACLTAGYERNSSGIRVPVSDRLSAGKWSASPIGLPSGGTEAGLEGISCSSASECMAVGLEVTGPSAERPYAALWRNGTWSVPAVKSPEALNAVLEGVSCASQSSCVAVGFSESSAGVVALSESWNGSAWSLTALPTPSGAGSSELSAVSCASPGECVAVGSYSAGASESSLAELWNGGAWTLQTTAGAGSQEELLGVSCPSAGECTAVGDHAQGTHTVAMVQTWNGAGWSAQASNVDEAQASELHAVSCATGSTCVAAGILGWSAQARSRSGSVEPLAEIRYTGPAFPAGNPQPGGNPPSSETMGAGGTSALGAALHPQLGLTADSGRQSKAPRCRVPSLRGASLARARSRLRLAHCALGRVRRPRRSHGALVVLHQGHSAGASLATNARINLMLGPR